MVSFSGGFALLPFLWLVNVVWFFREAFFKPAYTEQLQIKTCKCLNVSFLYETFYSALIFFYLSTLHLCPVSPSTYFCKQHSEDPVHSPNLTWKLIIYYTTTTHTHTCKFINHIAIDTIPQYLYYYFGINVKYTYE